MLPQDFDSFIRIWKVAWGIGQQCLFLLRQRDGEDRFSLFIDPLLASLQFLQLCNRWTDMRLIISPSAIKLCLKHGNFALQLLVTFLFLRPGFGAPLNLRFLVSFLLRQIPIFSLAILQTADCRFRNSRTIFFLCGQFRLQSIRLCF